MLVQKLTHFPPCLAAHFCRAYLTPLSLRLLAEAYGIRVTKPFSRADVAEAMKHDNVELYNLLNPDLRTAWEAVVTISNYSSWVTRLPPYPGPEYMLAKLAVDSDNVAVFRDMLIGKFAQSWFHYDQTHYVTPQIKASCKSMQMLEMLDETGVLYSRSLQSFVNDMKQLGAPPEHVAWVENKINKRQG